MAHSRSAKKRVRQNEKRRVQNIARKSALKTATRKIEDALKLDDAAKAHVLLRDAESKIARAKGKGLIKKNTAARKISRIARKVADAMRSAERASQ